MREPLLVASDMDGTLLDPAERVTERTARVVRRLVDAGTPFLLVTGRPPRWIPEPVAELGVTGLAVCSNGAVLYDTGADRVLSSSTLEPSTLRDIEHELRAAIPGCAVAVERVTDGAVDRVGEQFLAESAFHRAWPNGDITVVDRAELTARPAVKMLVLHERLGSDAMAAAARGVVAERAQLTYSTGAGLLELSAPGVDKASGLAEATRELGIDPADMIAFGDMPNDIALLDWVGHGVAMSGAHPRLLAVADEITGSNSEDGVAQVLERWW